MYFHNVVGTGSYTTSTNNMYNNDRFHARVSHGAVVVGSRNHPFHLVVFRGRQGTGKRQGFSHVLQCGCNRYKWSNVSQKHRQDSFGTRKKKLKNRYLVYLHHQGGADSGDHRHMHGQGNVGVQRKGFGGKFITQHQVGGAVAAVAAVAAVTENQ